MAAWLKFLIGLGAALATGWISHGPAGRGEAFINKIETRAKGMVTFAAVPGVSVRFSHDPLSREAIFSGQADEFQRNGQGEFLGLNGRILSIPGVSGVRWEGD